MLEWHDFVEQLLSEESSFDGISLSFDGTAHSVGVPPIIKASVLILDKMITHQGKFNKHTAPGDTLTAFFSDTGSTPVSSTKIKAPAVPRRGFLFWCSVSC